MSLAVAEAACNTDTTQTQPHQISNTQRTENSTTDVVIQQHSRKLLMMDILISEICWVHKKWNKIASDIKLVFYSSTITMMHGPINIWFCETIFTRVWMLNLLVWIFSVFWDLLLQVMWIEVRFCLLLFRLYTWHAEFCDFFSNIFLTDVIL